jgi:hypothetical protein
LTKTAVASPNAADGVECAITTTKTGDKTVNSLECGPEKKAFTYSEFHSTDPLKLVSSDAKNVDWAVNEKDNTVYWGALPKGSKAVSFSRTKGGSRTSIYAEVCSTYNHHDIFPGLGDFWERGVAKAYYQ